MKSITLGFWFSICLLVAGCFTGPTNGDVVCGADMALTFQGGSPDERSNGPDWDLVIVEAAAKREGPFKEVARARVGYTQSGTWGAWNTAPTVVPRALWGKSTTRELYLRARYGAPNIVNPIYFSTYDNPSLNTGQTTQCILDKMHAGADVNTAVIGCRSKDSPVIKIQAPLVSVCGCPQGVQILGDVLIDSVDAYDIHRCDADVTGNFEVARILDQTHVAFAGLHHVGGNLTVDYSKVPGSFGQRAVDLSALESVGGKVALRGSGAFGGMTNIDVNMGALSSVGGAIEATFMGGDVRVSGLSGLATAASDVNLTFDGLFDGALFLPNLTGIGGALRISNSIGMVAVLPALQEVTASVDFSYRGVAMRNEAIGLAKLVKIGGDLTFEGTPWNSFPGPDPAFGKLSALGGGLRLAGTRFASPRLGAANLSVGFLELISNPNMSTLPLAAQLPLRGAGDITVLDNPTLSECDVQGFASAQDALGWAGTLTSDGNMTCD